MGILDWFWKKQTPQEKAIAALRRNKIIQNKIKEARTTLGRMAGELNDFLNRLVQAPGDIISRQKLSGAINKLGWISPEFTLHLPGEREAIAVEKYRRSRLQQIMVAREKLLVVLSKLSAGLEEGGLGKELAEQNIALAAFLKQLFREYRAALEDNLVQLREMLIKTYSDLIFENAARKLFTEYFTQLANDLAILDALINDIDVLERQQAR